jgi:hypothetical protein
VGLVEAGFRAAFLPIVEFYIVYALKKDSKNIPWAYLAPNPFKFILQNWIFENLQHLVTWPEILNSDLWLEAHVMIIKSLCIKVTIMINNFQ